MPARSARPPSRSRPASRPATAIPRLAAYFFSGALALSPPLSFSVTTVPFLSLHSFSEASTQPLPLQPFLPAQPFDAPAHEPLPLHELMPPHLTLASLVLSSAWPTRGATTSRSPATVIAIAFPFMVIFIAPYVDLVVSPWVSSTRDSLRRECDDRR